MIEMLDVELVDGFENGGGFGNCVSELDVHFGS